MGLNRKLIRWVIYCLYKRKKIISIHDQLSDPITPIHGVPQDCLLSPILFILYVSDIPQPLDPLVNISQFVCDIAIWAQAAGICSINFVVSNSNLVQWVENETLSTFPKRKAYRFQCMDNS